MGRKKKEEIETKIVVEEVQETQTISNRISLIDIIEDDYQNLEVKHYLPLEAKWQIIDDIIMATTDINEQGMLEVDYKSEKLMFDIIMLREYTNINLADMEIQELYYGLTIPRDNFETGGIIDYIYIQINKEEIDYIRNCVNKTIEQKKELTNSLESVVDRGIKQFTINMTKTIEEISDKLINAIPTEKGMKSVIKQIKSFDPERATMVQSLVDTISGKKQTKPTNIDIPKMTKSDKEKLEDKNETLKELDNAFEKIQKITE